MPPQMPMMQAPGVDPEPAGDTDGKCGTCANYNAEASTCTALSNSGSPNQTGAEGTFYCKPDWGCDSYQAKAEATPPPPEMGAEAAGMQELTASPEVRIPGRNAY